MRVLGTAMVLMGVASTAFGLATPVPEIDGNSALAALALVSGGLLIIRGRRKK